MVVLREYHSSEKDFILNYLKDQHNISERINVKKMPSIDEVLRSQLKMFPISSDQGQAEVKPLDIPANYSAQSTVDKSSVIETKIRGILANKQPTDFAVKMFEPLSNLVRKPVVGVKLSVKQSGDAKPASTSAKTRSTGKPNSAHAKVHKTVKIKTPDTKNKPDTKLTGVTKKDKLVKPKAKSVVKALINSGTKGTTSAKISRGPITVKSRPLKPASAGHKTKKIKGDKAPKVVKQGSVSFPRLIKLEKPVPKTVKRKKLIKTPEKKVANKPTSLPLKMA